MDKMISLEKRIAYLVREIGVDAVEQESEYDDYEFPFDDLDELLSSSQVILLERYGQKVFDESRITQTNYDKVLEKYDEAHSKAIKTIWGTTFLTGAVVNVVSGDLGVAMNYVAVASFIGIVYESWQEHLTSHYSGFYDVRRNYKKKIQELAFDTVKDLLY